MSRALKNAGKPIAAPHPNPRVGCVIAVGSEIIGEGWHAEAGCAHAEVNALQSLRAPPDRATMYVTLEPCASHGLTPPCTDAVIASGIRRVIVGTPDPHHGTNGSGINALRDAGIEVRVGLLGDESRKMNKGFHALHETGKPWVMVKVASSIDGRIAMGSGESVWITGSESRDDVQRLRANAAAILTGSGTINADNPRLNCRIPNVKTNLIRVVVDSRLSIPEDSRLFSCDGEVIIATTKGSDPSKRQALSGKARVVELPADLGGKVDCIKLLQFLASDCQINSILVEAGPRLVGSLLAHGLVDEFVFYIAPSMLGNDAVGIADLPWMKRLSDKVRLQFQEFRKIGDDIRVRAVVERNAVAKN